MSTFTAFPKMARLTRDCRILEKLDGTNAQVLIYDPEIYGSAEDPNSYTSAKDSTGKVWFIKAGSRNRFVTPQNDNYGFAGWVWRNAEELVGLGEGRHFGEWWGNGIQRNYGLKEKRFSLFNTARWSDDAVRPACCHVVPVLYRGVFDTAKIEEELEVLAKYGSVAAPSFMNPEGVIVYHEAAGIGFKKTIKDDGVPKSLAHLS